jgi:hypothetical protein
MAERPYNAAPESPADRKAFVRKLLLNRELDSFLSWTHEHRDASRILNYLLFDSEELVRWRAIEAVGKMADLKAAANLEGVREIIRRMLWAMNDESGNSFWHAPEVIGEVLANVPRLTSEFVPTIPSLMKLEPYGRGVHWAMARIAGVTPDAFENFSGALIRSMGEADPFVRGYALLAFSPRWLENHVEKVEAHLEDQTAFTGYDIQSGAFRESTVGECARRKMIFLGLHEK